MPDCMRWAKPAAGRQAADWPRQITFDASQMQGETFVMFGRQPSVI